MKEELWQGRDAALAPNVLILDVACLHGKIVSREVLRTRKDRKTGKTVVQIWNSHVGEWVSIRKILQLTI